MRDIFKQLLLIIKELPSFIEEYLYDYVTNLQIRDIESVSSYDNEIWLI